VVACAPLYFQGPARNRMLVKGGSSFNALVGRPGRAAGAGRARLHRRFLPRPAPQQNPSIFNL
jgi:hypothetical protein